MEVLNQQMTIIPGKTIACPPHAYDVRQLSTGSFYGLSKDAQSFVVFDSKQPQIKNIGSRILATCATSVQNINRLAVLSSDGQMQEFEVQSANSEPIRTSHVHLGINPNTQLYRFTELTPRKFALIDASSISLFSFASGLQSQQSIELTSYKHQQKFFIKSVVSPDRSSLLFAYLSKMCALWSLEYQCETYKANLKNDPRDIDFVQTNLFACSLYDDPQIQLFDIRRRGGSVISLKDPRVQKHLVFKSLTGQSYMAVAYETSRYPHLGIFDVRKMNNFVAYTPVNKQILNIYTRPAQMKILTTHLHEVRSYNLQTL